jgi:16S rRNA (guanine966-N2)-methyltransferase
MRIIAGECKGRRLKAVPGNTTRPTTDKVRESIFNMVGPFFDGGLSLDLFGGSGALSIEGLSRGIDKAIIVDKNSKAIEIIRENLTGCGYSDRAEVYRNDAKRALRALIKRELQFRMIYLDPPYAKQGIVPMIQDLEKYYLLQQNGTIVVEHAKEVSLPDVIGSYSRIKYETYSGTTSVSIYDNGGNTYEAKESDLPG